jgi:hypothetical protein
MSAAGAIAEDAAAVTSPRDAVAAAGGAEAADKKDAAAGEDPVPMTPAAAIRDVTFVTPRSSFSGGDQGPGQRRRAARWARDSAHGLPSGAAAAAAAAGSPGLAAGVASSAALTPLNNSSTGGAERVSDSIADVAHPGDSCSSASKARAGSLSASAQRLSDKQQHSYLQQQQQLFEKTPTPARNAVAGIEARILAKIAAVCSPAAGRRSVAVGSAGGASLSEEVTLGGKPAWKE